MRLCFRSGLCSVFMMNSIVGTKSERFCKEFIIFNPKRNLWSLQPSNYQPMKLVYYVIYL